MISYDFSFIFSCNGSFLACKVRESLIYFKKFICFFPSELSLLLFQSRQNNDIYYTLEL